MKKKKNVRNIVKDAIIVILVLICVGEGVLLKSFVFNGKPGTVNSFKLQIIQKAIDQYYLYDVDEEKLTEYAYKGYVAGLGDPYSTYYTKEEYQKIREEDKGVFSGIGAVLQQDSDGNISVVRTMKGSPAEEAKLHPGDILVKVDGQKLTKKEDISTVVSKVKGKEGTTVKLAFMRGKKVKEYTLTRRQIESSTVEYEMLDDKVGYIRITEFDEITVTQFSKAVDELKAEGMERMILDLRNNPGGLLLSAVSIADKILPKGLVVYTQDKYGKKEEFNASSDDELGVPLAVLVNARTGSASEVLSGAIQDYGYGTLVGETTFGKGIVQTTMNLGDGSALKLTITDYYTPKGRNIHDKGIKPDVEIELDENLLKKVTIEKNEDNQLKKAIKIVKDLKK
ncbi:MAG: S41 family peptidase [Lachnospiraceae bacterium]|nr:S41 family peptidase [Lachnospiraceae bacterium]